MKKIPIFISNFIKCFVKSVIETSHTLSIYILRTLKLYTINCSLTASHFRFRKTPSKLQINKWETRRVEPAIFQILWLCLLDNSELIMIRFLKKDWVKKNINWNQFRHFIGNNIPCLFSLTEKFHFILQNSIISSY